MDFRRQKAGDPPEQKEEAMSKENISSWMESA